MKRKADLISTNSVGPGRKISKKRPRSGQRLQIDAVDDNPLAVVVYDGGSTELAAKAHHRDGKKKKSRKPREKIEKGPNPPPGLPTEFVDIIRRMGGIGWRLIIQKGLQDTDLSSGHNRLSIPSSQWVVDADFMASGLLMMFEGGENSVCLPVIDPKMQVWETMSLRTWNMTKTMLVLAGKWNKLAKANGLKVNDVVQIWCFKFSETGKYGLAIVKIERSVASHSDNSRPNSLKLSLPCSQVPQPYDCRDVAGSSAPPQKCDSAGSSTSSYATHYKAQLIGNFDIWNTAPPFVLTGKNESDDHRGHEAPDKVLSSESSKPDDGSDSHRRIRALAEVAAAEYALLVDKEISSSEIDLTLHL